MSQVPPFQECVRQSEYCSKTSQRRFSSRLASAVSRPPSRRLLYETLEARQLLSVANSAQQQTLADLPVAAQEAVSAAMTREQSAYPSVQEAKLTASGGAAGDNSGFSVAISGSTVVVGAPWATVNDHSQQGAAYIFTESGSVWTQAAELTASDGHSDDGFGYSVAISGNTVVVGSDILLKGAAYVFTKPGSGWTNMTQTAKLTDGAVKDDFGNSVSITGKTVVVGAPAAPVGGVCPGAAYVFTERGSAWTSMTPTAELTASDGQQSDGFGDSVSISGSTVVAGAPYNNNQGAAYVFTERGSAWTGMTQTAKLTASDGAAADLFGNSVSISGNTVVVGAPRATVNGHSQQGAAYVFTKSALGWGDMTQTAKLTASDGAAQDTFGYAVSISGNTLVVGAPSATIGSNTAQGAAYVFTEPGSAWTDMTQTAKLTATNGQLGDCFGFSMAISDNTLALGAPSARVGNNSGQGAAYIFVEPPAVKGVACSGGPAAGGTPVTITGTGFTGATAVNFGTTKATHFTIVSSTEITAKSPAGTGVVDVSVTTPKGTSAVNRPADEFSYAPVVTKISPSQGSATGGTTVTITGTNLLHAETVDFGTVAGKITKDTATQIVVKSPEGTGTVNVTVTAAGGTSASYQFTYVAAPAGAFAQTANAKMSSLSSAVISASPAAAPSLGGASTNGVAVDAALRTLLSDDSNVTGKPRLLFEP